MCVDKNDKKFTKMNFPTFCHKIDHFRLGMCNTYYEKSHRDDLLPENILFKHIGVESIAQPLFFRNKTLQSEVKTV